MTSFELTSEMIYLLVITDPMEECDDESAIYYLREVANNRKDLFIEVLCVGGKVAENERLLRVWEVLKSKGECESDNFKVGCLTDMPRYAEYFSLQFVLQIGPIQSLRVASKLAVCLTKYVYMLMGALGTTNSNRDSEAYESALLLQNKSERQMVFATKVGGKLRCPQFTGKTSRMFPDMIRNEILRVGFRNTVGRAPANLKFLNQLVGPGGANYEVVKSMWEKVQGESENLFESLSLVCEEHRDELKSAIEAYNPELKDTEKEGLTLMQIALSSMFGLEFGKIYVSSDPCFEMLNLQSSGSPAKSMSNLIKEFRAFEVMTVAKGDVGLTPCYDLAAAYCAITYLLDPDQHGAIFEDVKEGEFEHIVIRERYNTSRFVELCMTDGVYGDTEERPYKMRGICRTDVSSNGIRSVEDVEKLFGKNPELGDGPIESSELKRNMTMANGHVIPPTTHEHHAPRENRPRMEDVSPAAVCRHLH